MGVLACPHCGGTILGEVKDAKTFFCYIECAICGMRGPFDDTIKKAIKLWNSLPREKKRS